MTRSSGSLRSGGAVRLRVAAAAAVAMLLGSGCRSLYLTRLAMEEAHFLRDARPATELLATTQDPERRRTLQTLLDVRKFAADEGLDVGGSYRKVTDSHTTTPFHVVTAAYADRLEPYTWWYPIVGSIPYRGYFDREPAEEFAADLRKEGLDTMIVDASAYSTLGWFDDPLPSSVLDRGEYSVVVTVLHELTHQTFFAPGEIELNETLATAVSWRLAEKFYASRANVAGAARARVWRESWIARSDALDAAAETLRKYFADAHASGQTREQMLEGRKQIYAALLADIDKVDHQFADGFREDGLDNATFLAAHRYADGGRAIDAYLASEPSIADALARLSAAQKNHKDVRRTVILGPVPVP